MQNRECEFDFLKNSFKTAKFVERLRKRRQNNLSGKFHILLNNTQTQNSVKSQQNNYCAR
jgi:hypothetical protein